MSQVIGNKLPSYTLSGVPAGGAIAASGVPLAAFVWGVLIDGVEIGVLIIININISFDFSDQNHSVTLAVM
jgi:hypothetical protein